MTARPGGIFRSDDDIASDISHVRKEFEGAGSVPRAFVIVRQGRGQRDLRSRD